MKKLIKDVLGLALVAAVVLFVADGTAWALDVEKELKGLESTYCKNVAGSNKLRLEKCIEKEKKAKEKVEKSRGTTAESQCRKKLRKNLSYEMLDRCIASKERPKVKEKKDVKKGGGEKPPGVVPPKGPPKKSPKR